MRPHSSLILSLCAVAYSQPQVQLGSTTVTGRTITGPPDVEFFGGMPFAQPPVGNLRLAPPVYMSTPGVATLDASQYGPECLQGFGGTGQSEDCLTVNIIRPANLPANSALPVMFWIYGGGFYSGAANPFDGTDLVARSVTRGTPIIFASFNYRVGPLGFPTGNEAATDGLTNAGIKDAMAALQWIHDNVGAFGGDNTKVTAFGESAGSILLSILHLNPNIDQLIRAGIMESGSATSMPIVKVSAKEADWEFFVSFIPECANVQPDNTVACVRSATSAELSQAMLQSYSHTSDPNTFFPVVDGPGGVLPDSPIKLYNQGHFARIPFISGDNLDEGTFWVPISFNSTAEMRDYIIHNLSLTAYPQAVQDAVSTQLMVLYPNIPALGSPYNTGNNTFGHSPQWKRETSLMGDLLFQAPRRLLTRTFVQAGVTGYGYLLTDPQPELGADLGVPHAADLPYLFPNLNLPPFAPPRMANQLALGSDIMDYWISFADSQSPNDNHGNTNRPNWPQYTLASKHILELNSGGTTLIADTYRQAPMDYLIAEEITVDRNPMMRMV